jgi:outer membrane protein TolC
MVTTAAVFALACWAEPPARITVDDAVVRALEHNGNVLASRANARADHALAKSEAGRMLPQFFLTNEYQRFTSPFAIAFGPPPAFTVREIQDNIFVASGRQALVGLLRLGEERAAQASSAEASDAGARSTEDTVREQVQVEYLRYFEAQALEDIARTSREELQQQVHDAEVKLAAGVLTKADVLRAQTAVKNAEQQTILAHTQAEIAHANLFALLGLPPQARVELVEPESLLAAAKRPPPPAEDARARADIARPELAQARKQAQSAEQRQRARLYALLPEVDLEGAYQHTTGQVFFPVDQAFIGVAATWNIWAWGANYYAEQAAAAQAEAAQRDLTQRTRDVGAEVDSRLAQTQAATAAISVAEQAIRSAEEAYRVTRAQLDAGAATTTDLLDSQSALTQARLSLARARYEQAIANVQLQRAMGTR